MSHNRSSDDQIEIIIRFAGIISHARIAEIAGVSERTVRKYIAEYGLDVPRRINAPANTKRRKIRPKYTILQRAVSKKWKELCA